MIIPDEYLLLFDDMTLKKDCKIVPNFTIAYTELLKNLKELWT